jgi:hypothetical protein
MKQGDPLSPLLFGIFIDRLEAFLATRAPEPGVRGTGRLLRVILYADDDVDIIILVDSAHDLQALLDVLQDFLQPPGCP